MPGLREPSFCQRPLAFRPVRQRRSRLQLEGLPSPGRRQSREIWPLRGLRLDPAPKALDPVALAVSHGTLC